MTTLRVAVAQAAQVPLDLDEAVTRAERWIDRAGEAGARLVAFGESFLAGYPFWCDAGEYGAWDHAPARALHARFAAQALALPSAHLDAVCAAARRADCAVVIGANERTPTGSLFNALLFIDRAGALVATHRKLVPTHGERLVHTPGDAAALRAHDLGVGVPVGGLICWEHWMPLPRQVLHAAGEILHVSAWPGCRDTYHMSSRHYAFEGRCFVLSAAVLQRRADLPADFDLPAALEPERDGWLIDGGSSIIGPDAVELAGPVRGEESLLVADLDLDEALAQRHTLDVAGHYARADLFTLSVRRDRPQLVVDQPQELA